MLLDALAALPRSKHRGAVPTGSARRPGAWRLRRPPPRLSSETVWSPILNDKGIGREEAFSEEQIIGVLREVEAGMPIKDLCRQHGFSEASYYLWRSKFGGMSVPDAERLKDLDAENTRLKKLLAEQVLENDIIKDASRKMW